MRNDQLERQAELTPQSKNIRQSISGAELTNYVPGGRQLNKTIQLGVWLEAYRDW